MSSEQTVLRESRPAGRLHSVCFSSPHKICGFCGGAGKRPLRHGCAVPPLPKGEARGLALQGDSLSQRRRRCQLPRRGSLGICALLIGRGPPGEWLAPQSLPRRGSLGICVLLIGRGNPWGMARSLKPPSLREVARRSRDGGSYPRVIQGAGFYGGTPSVTASGGDSSLREGAWGFA